MKILQRYSRRQWMIGGTILGLLVLAVGLAFYQFGLRKPVASPTVLVRRAATALPAEPWAPEWNKVSATVMPLAVVSTPGATTRNVSVRALNDGKTLAVRLEWEDTSKEVTTLRPQDFADAAAVQLSGSVSQACMGQVGSPVQIWQWKSDWQEGSRKMATRYPNMYVDGFQDDKGNELFTEDLYSRPAFAAGNARAAATKESFVEYQVAQGFGTLTSAGAHEMKGKGEWQKGKWAVVFTRPLASGGAGDVALAPGTPLQAAFAVWDGKLMQRDGMKFATGWAVLQLK